MSQDLFSLREGQETLKECLSQSLNVSSESSLSNKTSVIKLDLTSDEAVTTVHSAEAVDDSLAEGNMDVSNFSKTCGDTENESSEKNELVASMEGEGVSADDEEVVTPVDDEQEVAPMDDEGGVALVVNEGEAAPLDDEKERVSADDEEEVGRMDDEEEVGRMDNEEVAHMDNEEVAHMDNEEVAHTDNEEVAHMDNEDVASMDNEEEVARMDNEDEMVPTNDEEQVVPEDAKEEVGPKDDKEEVALEDDKEEVTPEDDKEEVVAPEDVKEEVVAPEDDKEQIVAPEDDKEQIVAPEDDKEQVVASEDHKVEVPPEDDKEEVASGDDKEEVTPEDEDAVAPKIDEEDVTPDDIPGEPHEDDKDPNISFSDPVTTTGDMEEENNINEEDDLVCDHETPDSEEMEGLQHAPEKSENAVLVSEQESNLPAEINISVSAENSQCLPEISVPKNVEMVDEKDLTESASVQEDILKEDGMPPEDSNSNIENAEEAISESLNMHEDNPGETNEQIESALEADDCFQDEICKITIPTEGINMDKTKDNIHFENNVKFKDDHIKDKTGEADELSFHKHSEKSLQENLGAEEIDQTVENMEVDESLPVDSNIPVDHEDESIQPDDSMPVDDTGSSLPVGLVDYPSDSEDLHEKEVKIETGEAKTQLVHTPCFEEDAQSSWSVDATKISPVKMKELTATVDEDSRASSVSQRSASKRPHSDDDVLPSFTAEQLFEYRWPADSGEFFLIQEHVSEFLVVKSFKRKYPDLTRRPVEVGEKRFLKDKGVVTETLCDLGLTAIRSDDVLELMSKDYPEKYQEYIRVLQERERLKISNKHKEYSTPSIDKTKMNDFLKKAIKATAEFNMHLNQERREERRSSFDMQTYTIHIPANKIKKLSKEATKVGKYPVALLPGQFQDYYRPYTPQELKYFPINTVLYGPLKELPTVYTQPSSDGSNSDSDDSCASEGSCCSSSQGTHDSGESSSGSESVPRMKTEPNPELQVPPLKIKDRLNATCKVCHSTHERNKKGCPEDLIHCSECGSSGHPSCLDVASEIVEAIRTYAWQCMDCKTCMLCMDPYDEDKMMFCDKCDRGYHTFCVGLKNLPNGRWICRLCGQCSGCGARTPGPEGSKAQWQQDSSKSNIEKKQHLLCLTCAKPSKK